MGTNTYFIASPFSASDSIKVAQDNECITMGEVIKELENDGITYENAQKINEIMNQSFKIVFCVEEEFTEPVGEVGVSGLKEVQVERKEIERILEKLDIRKTMRPDGDFKLNIEGMQRGTCGACLGCY